MAPRDRVKSIIVALSGVAVGTALLGLLALVGAWLVGGPDQAAASPLDPTPTAGLPAPTDVVTVSLPALKTPAPTPLPPTSVQPTPLPPTEIAPTAAPATVTAGDGSVNVRSGPGTEFSKMGMLSPGEEATVIGRHGDWWQIDYARESAWVASWVVTAHNVADVPEVPAVPTPVGPSPTKIPPSARPGAMDDDRWIDVDLSEQRLTAYENGVAVHTTLVSTGLPQTPTPTGQFRIWIKLRYDDMAGADYYIEDVPYVMYFHEGYGLHGVTWHGNFGHPMSHGCVNLPTEEAEWLFNWADVGTLVSIRA
jgi:lipoprotein-anchoring transpeptidase ErfK/SrfK